MRTDNIVKVEIDSLDRLCIYPEKEKFTLIWRSATEVHWDDKGLFLYSPKPREWSYLDWYRQITSVISTEYNCQLLITGDTIWINISNNLQKQILES
jgi:hypothetical protein